MSGEPVGLFLVERCQNLLLFRLWRAAGHNSKRPLDSLVHGLFRFADEFLRQDPGGLKELRIVEQNKRLEWGGGRLAFCGANLASHGIEGEHARRRSGATPKRVEAAPVKIRAVVLG